MKALVTGADGFVGQYLVAELLEQGFAVAASVRDLPPCRTTLTPAHVSSVEWKAADVRDHDALYRVVAATLPERIYHLAGFSSGALARRFASDAVHVNTGGTVNLFEAVVSVREDDPAFDPRVLVMGSGDAYGDAALEGQPLEEHLSLRPVSVYGLSKSSQELAAHTYRRSHDLQIFVVRAFHLVGPGQQAPFVVPEFCTQAARIAAGKAEPVMTVGNLGVERDFTDVRDAVRAFRMLMELEAPRAAYNVASGRGVRVGTILDWIVDEAGIEVDIAVDSERVRQVEPPAVVGDVSRLREDTGWVPQRELEATVRESYRWARSHFGSPGNTDNVV
jgi:GDP-4-dehydro-6-deoxy-D-mannose reductase